MPLVFLAKLREHGDADGLAVVAFSLRTLPLDEAKGFVVRMAVDGYVVEIGLYAGSREGVIDLAL